MPYTIYTLEVFIIGGPVTGDFIEANPEMSRTIEIRGDQTLEDLHRAIFEAFDRVDQHAYEFHFGDEPHDFSRGRYAHPAMDDAPFMMSRSKEPGSSWEIAEDPNGDVTTATIDGLDLEVGDTFCYWFDFGDNWYHQIEVLGIEERTDNEEYPRVVNRVGESPPQYPQLDQEDW